MECYVCPHRCVVDRPADMHAEGMFGSCHCGLKPIVARAALHFWEEPCISGEKGSGTVFFSGCNLHCVFCQNYEISSLNKGKEITVQRLREIYFELIAQGANNINLVTPTHFTHAILESLKEPLPVPVVYNTSGFETLDTLRKLKGKVQIWLPDLKYSDDLAAIKYSNAPSYFRIATDAIKEMYKQVGPYKLNDDGIMQSGVIIRQPLSPAKLCSALCTSMCPAAALPITPKLTAALPTRNTPKLSSTCLTAALRTALCRRTIPPARTSSPNLTALACNYKFCL